MRYVKTICQNPVRTGMASSIAGILLFATTLSAGTFAIASDNNCTISPSIDKTPESIVKTVIEALKVNDDDDSGIATVYCFASPGNKQMTGPIERFAGMIKSGYGDMLNHADSEFDSMEIREDVAIQPVWLTTAGGDVVGYLFRLGKQTTGEFAGMWMTEAVYKIDPSKRQQSI